MGCLEYYTRISDFYFLGLKAHNSEKGRFFETLCGLHPEPQGIRYSAAVIIK
jgi:hypothetical protein